MEEDLRDRKHKEKEEHCAGALIFMVHTNTLFNNRMMRWAVNSGWFSPEMLSRKVPVYKTRGAMRRAARKANP